MRAAALVLLLSAGAEARECGTVVVPAGVGISTPAPVNSLHPALYTGTLYEQQTMELLFRPLIWTDRQHRIDWSESIASKIEAADGNTMFRVTMRPFTWSDGRPVTADDVLYDWELIHALGATYVNYRTGGIPQLVQAVTVTGPLSFEVRLTRAVNPDWFELSGLGQFTPLPRHAWGRYTIAQQQSLQSTASFYGVVDGPFRLAELNLARYAVFTPNPSYSGHKPAIRRLVVDFLQGSDPLSALEAGQVDIANLPFDVWDAANALKGFDHVQIGPSALLYSIIPNIADPDVPFMADVRVRQAMSVAIDQQQLMRVVFHGNSLPDRGFVPTALTNFLAPGLQDGDGSLRFDPARARTLLDQAGWVQGTDGIRTRNGKRLAFSVLVTAGLAERLEMLQLIQGDLAHVGIGLDIKEIEFNQLFARMLGPTRGWDAVFIGWSMPGYPDGMQWFATGSTGNFEHYSNPEMDRLLKAATDEPGDKGLFGLEQFALEQQPMIFLPSGFYTVLVRPGIDGVTKFISPSGKWAPEYLTLHGAMACDAAHA